MWEGFFPEAKRRWGYYVLPIVFGDRFVGRIEPRIEGELPGVVRVLERLVGERLRVRAALTALVNAMRDVLRAYRLSRALDRLEWAPHLTTEQRLFEARE